MRSCSRGGSAVAAAGEGGLPGASVMGRSARLPVPRPAATDIAPAPGCVDGGCDVGAGSAAQG